MWNDLSHEATFQKFMDTEPETYDKSSEWYRWHVSIDASQYEGSFGVGSIQKIEVTKREKSGQVSQITIKGTKGDKVISNQQDIRDALLEQGEEITLADGSVRSGFSSLPSAAFYLQEQKEKANLSLKINICGGGFGHGVGMSQSGACEMAKQGWDCGQILEHYFPGCSSVIAKKCR